MFCQLLNVHFRNGQSTKMVTQSGENQPNVVTLQRERERERESDLSEKGVKMKVTLHWQKVSLKERTVKLLKISIQAFLFRQEKERRGMGQESITLRKKHIFHNFCNFSLLFNKWANLGLFYVYFGPFHVSKFK